MLASRVLVTEVRSHTASLWGRNRKRAAVVPGRRKRAGRASGLAVAIIGVRKLRGRRAVEPSTSGPRPCRCCPIGPQPPEASRSAGCSRLCRMSSHRRRAASVSVGTDNLACCEPHHVGSEATTRQSIQLLFL
jgi:hypothetical protein